jgi:hypothetical protein
VSIHARKRSRKLFKRGMLVALSHLSSVARSSVASDRRTVVVVRRCCHQPTEIIRVVNCFGRSTSLPGKWGASPFFLAEHLCFVGVVLRVEWPYDQTRRAPRFCALTSSTSMRIDARKPLCILPFLHVPTFFVRLYIWDGLRITH